MRCMPKIINTLEYIEVTQTNLEDVIEFLGKSLILCTRVNTDVISVNYLMGGDTADTAHVGDFILKYPTGYYIAFTPECFIETYLTMPDVKNKYEIVRSSNGPTVKMLWK
jgi:hypothetical protein